MPTKFGMFVLSQQLGAAEGVGTRAVRVQGYRSKGFEDTGV